MLAFRVSRALAAPAMAIGACALLMPVATPAARADSLAPIWNGVYAGFHGGAKWSEIDTDFSSAISANDIAGGGHIGYNLALAGLVVGIEADADLDSTKFGFDTAGGGTGSFETEWSGSIRARVGMPVGPALLYATAGYTWTEATLSQATLGGGKSSSNTTFNGVVFGVGAEAYVLPNLSLRLEALRYEYGAEDLSISGANSVIDEIDPSDTVVRAGVTFHLN
jgi:outer membrane immunogenic protein